MFETYVPNSGRSLEIDSRLTEYLNRRELYSNINFTNREKKEKKEKRQSVRNYHAMLDDLIGAEIFLASLETMHPDTFYELGWFVGNKVQDYEEPSCSTKIGAATEVALYKVFSSDVTLSDLSRENLFKIYDGLHSLSFKQNGNIADSRLCDLNLTPSNMGICTLLTEVDQCYFSMNYIYSAMAYVSNNRSRLSPTYLVCDTTGNNVNDFVGCTVAFILGFINGKYGVNLTVAYKDPNQHLMDALSRSKYLREVSSFANLSEESQNE